MNSHRKLFLLSSLFLVAFLYNILKNIKNPSSQINKIFELIQNLENVTDKLKVVRNEEIKYILQWTNWKNVPFVYMGVGRQGFIDRNCEFTNCYVTNDSTFIGDVSKFHVIAFAGPEISIWLRLRLFHLKKPRKRSPHQKYVFASIESASNYPICSAEVNDFFNWTWTFRLDSESRWGYIIIRDANGVIIGPNSDMHWMKLEDMDPVKEELKNVLKKKTIAAAWFVSNCRSRSGREKFANDLQKALEKHNLRVDIYGHCGPLTCSRDNEEKCFQLIKNDYYFYLAMENSFSKDYVTEKLLHGLKYNAVPIVYGSANYTR